MNYRGGRNGRGGDYYKKCIVNVLKKLLKAFNKNKLNNCLICKGILLLTRFMKYLKYLILNQVY